MSIEEIRRYIQVELLNDPTAQIDADEDLLLSETLDSLRVMRLVAHLEDETGLMVPAQDITLENFRSLEQIVSYLDRRRRE